MQTLTSSGVRKEWSTIVGAVEHRRQCFAIVRNGRLVAALIPYDQVEFLAQREDDIDLSDARAAVAAGGNEKRVDWEWLKDYTGLE